VTARRHRSAAGELRARRPSAWQRAETWLWTGPVGHLVGGALDLMGALAVYWFGRARDSRRG